jgi:hypothetical protein
MFYILYIFSVQAIRFGLHTLSPFFGARRLSGQQSTMSTRHKVQGGTLQGTRANLSECNRRNRRQRITGRIELTLQVQNGHGGRFVPMF